MLLHAEMPALACVHSHLHHVHKGDLHDHKIWFPPKLYIHLWLCMYAMAFTSTLQLGHLCVCTTYARTGKGNSTCQLTPTVTTVPYMLKQCAGAHRRRGIDACLAAVCCPAHACNNAFVLPW